MTRFSLYFFISFIGVGAYASWLAPYLDFCGVGAAAIGYSFAVVSICRAVTPPGWGLLADRLERKHLLLALVTLGAGSSFVPLFLGGPVWLLLASTVVFGLFFAPLYPLVDAQVLGFLGPARTGYGRIRLFGSVGFLVVNLAIGPLVTGLGLRIVPWILVVPLVVAAAIAAALPVGPTRADATLAAPAPIGSAGSDATSTALPWRRLLPILIAVILVQASHSPYWAYFATFLGKHEVSPGLVGLLLATAVAAEIAAMALAPTLIRKWGARRVRLSGRGRAVVRWLVCGMTTELWLLWPSQLLHAGSYALVYVAAVALVDDASPTSHKALGQTLLSACSHGIGLGGGFFVAGALVDRLQFPGLALVAAGACVLGAAVLLVTEPRTRTTSRAP